MEENEKNIVKTNIEAKNGQTKCPKCGATDISLNTKTGKLRCNFCRNQFEPEKFEEMENNIENLEGEVIDNTNIVNQKNAGELFLQAIITNCDDAFLWKSSSHNPTCIDVGLQLKNSLEPIINTQDYNTLTIEEKSKIGD